MRILSPFKHTRYRFYKLLNKIGLLQYVNVSTTITINNRQIKIPVIAGHGYQNLIISEAWANKLYKKLLSALDGTFIDVGANNGQTMIKIMAIDPLRHYLGFEPNPNCYNYTRKILQVNGFANCTLFPVGISNQAILLPLYQDTEFASGASVLKGFRENMSRFKIIQQVALMQGDSIISNLNLTEISIIKADVEGAELEVVEGLMETVKKYRPVVLLEILPVYSLEKPNGLYRYNRQQLLLELLHSIHYQMYLVNEKEISLEAIDEIEVHSDMGKTNYLFVPEEKKLLVDTIFSK